MHSISQETLKRAYTLSHAALISYAMAVGKKGAYASSSGSKSRPAR